MILNAAAVADAAVVLSSLFGDEPVKVVFYTIPGGGPPVMVVDDMFRFILSPMNRWARA